jgi:hypothetical protein
MADLACIAAEEEEPPHTFSTNVALVSDYRFRGISQSLEDPAVQGGFDYVHAAGAYLGTWASSVSSDQYLGGSGMEWDVYGGYRRTLGNVILDVGVLYYFYPSARLPTIDPGGSERYDTLEAYARVTWRWLTLQYWYALTDILGIQESTYGGACDRAGVDCFGTALGGSDGSGYVNLGAAYPLTGKLTLVAHAGHQAVSHYGKLDFTDWKAGLTYDLRGFVLGAAWVTTDADDDWYYASGADGTRTLGDATVVLSISRTF